MSEDAVRCDFQVSGMSAVKEAFGSYEAALMRLEKMSVKFSDAEERGVMRVSRARHVEASRGIKTAATAADARSEIAKREAAKRLDAQKGMLSTLDRLERDHTAKVAVEAKKRAAAEIAAADAVTKRRSQMSSALTGGLSRGVARPLGGAMALGGMALGVSGAFALADAGRSYMGTDAAARGLANSMYNPNDDEQKKFLGKGRFDTKKLMAFAGEVSAESGVDKKDFLTGAQSYIAKSSDWKAMTDPKEQGTMRELAKLSVASGTEFGQLMSAAGSLKVQNPKLDSAGMMEMMRGIVGQGKMGAVEISDLAQHASVITSGAGKSVGKGGYKDQAEAQSAMLGLSQIAIRTSGSAAEAATAVKSFGADIGGKADQAQKTFHGLKLKDDKGTLLKNSTIVENLFNAVQGDTTKLGEGKGKVGMGRESIRIMEALKTQFDIGKADALKNDPKLSDKQANAAGAKAAAAEVTKFENATYSKKDVERDHAEVVAGAGKKIEMATARIKEALEVKMAPIVERIADAFVKNEKGLLSLAEGLGSLTGWLLENPIKGVGLVIAGSLTKEISQAAIGQAVKNAMELPAMQGASAKFTAALGILSVAVLATAAGMKLIDDAMLEKSKKDSEQAAAGGNLDRARSELLEKVRHGKGTEEDVKKARDTLSAARAQQTEEVKRSADDAANPLRMIAAIADPEAEAGRVAAEKKERERAAKAITDFAVAVEGVAVAVKKHTGQITLNPPPAANPHNASRNVPMTSTLRGGTDR